MRSFLRLSVAAAAALTVSTSSSECNTGCTLIGCVSGFTLQLSSVPASPYRAEVYSGPPQSRFVAVCNQPDGCGGRAFLPDFRPSCAFVELTVGTDTTRREIVGPIHYATSNPNGRDCGPAGYSATVTVKDGAVDAYEAPSRLNLARKVSEPGAQTAVSRLVAALARQAQSEHDSLVCANRAAA